MNIYTIENPSGDIIGINRTDGKLGCYRSNAFQMVFTSKTEAMNFIMMMEENGFRTIDWTIEQI